MADEINPQDQMNIHLLARIAALEGILMIAMNHNPNRDEIIRLARSLASASDVVGLNTSAPDGELAIAAAAREKTMSAVFYDLPQQSTN